MSQVMDTQRRTQLIWVAGLAAVLSVAAIGFSISRASRDWVPEVSGPVFTDWAAQVAAAERIAIITPEDRFELQRRGDDWVMPSRDGYPVQASHLADLDHGLGALVYEGARTADVSRHARLGLAETGRDGAGTRITLQDAAGADLVDVILGEQRNGLTYLRFPGSTRTYAARTDADGATSPIPPTADQWLELDFIALDRARIARAEIVPETGPAYRLERASPTSRNFALRSPRGWEPITAGAGNGPGAALSRLRFRDVRLADRLSGPRIARHEAETFDGLIVTLDIIAQGDTRWARVSASALTDDAEPAAMEINRHALGWAFLLSELSVDRILRPLDEIAESGEGGNAP